MLSFNKTIISIGNYTIINLNLVFNFANKRVSCNPMTTDRATSNRHKNDPKSQPHKMAHLVLPDTKANASQNQKSHFFANALTSFRH